MSSDRGFTLVEVMISLFIIAILTAGGTTLIMRTVSSKESLERVSGDVSVYASLHTRIRDDLLQWVPRAAESRPGIDPKVRFLGGGVGDSTMLFAFVRDGWTNPELAEPRSSLMSVRYSFEGDRLIRRVQTAADTPYSSEGLEQVLMEGVRDAFVEFREGQQWVPQWRSTEGDPLGAPPAVRLTFVRNDGEEFEWLFLTPTGALL